MHNRIYLFVYEQFWPLFINFFGILKEHTHHPSQRSSATNNNKLYAQFVKNIDVGSQEIFLNNQKKSCIIKHCYYIAPESVVTPNTGVKETLKAKNNFLGLRFSAVAGNLSRVIVELPPTNSEPNRGDKFLRQLYSMTGKFIGNGNFIL